MRFRTILLRVLIVVDLGIINGTDVHAGDEPSDKPQEVALNELLKHKERTVNGVLMRLTKAEAVETDPKVADRKVILKMHWTIEYSANRWPLVILEPSLERGTSGQTRLRVFAKGQSGNVFGARIDSSEARRPEASD